MPHVMQIDRPIILAVTVTFAGCDRGTVITITNRSPVVLTDVVVSGSGFSERVDSIAPGTERKLAVRARGESGVRIAFEAAGQHIDTPEQGYFEAGSPYTVAVTVGPDLKV